MTRAYRHVGWLVYVIKCANCLRKMTCEVLNTGVSNCAWAGGGGSSTLRSGVASSKVGGGGRIGRFEVGLPVRNILGRPIHLQLDARGCFSMI